MKHRIAFNLLALLFVLTLTVPLEADWKSDWEKVVEAAKKEGRLNLYVGHRRMGGQNGDILLFQAQPRPSGRWLKAPTELRVSSPHGHLVN